MGYSIGARHPHDPAITEEVARKEWVEHSQAVMMSVDATGYWVCYYYLRAISLILGDHVAYAGYMVGE